MRRGWEFWLGAFFVGAAVCIIVPAFVIAEWRDVVSQIGAATAAFAVVGAALIAYDGATSKVRYDADHAARASADEASSLNLRLNLAVAELGDEIDEVVARFELRSPDTDAAIASFRLSEPTEVVEAWRSAASLPEPIRLALRDLRIALRRYSRLLDSVGPTMQRRMNKEEYGRNLLLDMRSSAKEIARMTYVPEAIDAPLTSSENLVDPRAIDKGS